MNFPLDKYSKKFATTCNINYYYKWLCSCHDHLNQIKRNFTPLPFFNFFSQLKMLSPRHLRLNPVEIDHFK